MTEQAKPTAAELAQWAEACERATKGDLMIEDYEEAWGVYICSTGPDGQPVATMSRADAEWFLAARTAMPRLLAEVVRLRTLLYEAAQVIGPPSAYQRDQTGERDGAYETAAKLAEELGLQDE